MCHEEAAHTQNTKKLSGCFNSTIIITIILYTHLDVQVDNEVFGWVLRVLEDHVEEYRPHLEVLKGTDLAGADDWLLRVGPSEDVHPSLLHHCKQVRIVLERKQTVWMIQNVSCLENFAYISPFKVPYFFSLQRQSLRKCSLGIGLVLNKLQ